MYKNIVIPVSFDTTRDTEQAIDAAKALADKGATFTLLHVVEELPGYYTRYLPDDAFTINRKKFQEDLDALAVGFAGAKTEIVDGHSGRDIVRWAADNEADCIVIASHKPALSDILLGSTAHYVVRHAACAVHVIR